MTGSALSQETPPPASRIKSERSLEKKEDPKASPKEEPETKSDSEDEEETKDLFGDDGQKDPANPDDLVDTIDATHMLTFQFTSRVKFAQEVKNEKGIVTGAAPPHLTIEYDTHFEIPVRITKNKETAKIQAVYDVDQWGSLARNEFFDCRLDIAMPEIPVEITTRLKSKKIKDEDNEDKVAYDLALGLDFSKEKREDWFSLCTDVSGAVLNTKGEQEDYSFRVLKLIDPSLKSIFIEDYDPLEKNKIDLSADPTIIEDADIDNDITLSGKGSISLDPL